MNEWEAAGEGWHGNESTTVKEDESCKLRALLDGTK
jgi:hypothetical protein